MLESIFSASLGAHEGWGLKIPEFLPVQLPSAANLSDPVTSTKRVEFMILIYTNGNLNGRVARLIADRIAQNGEQTVRVIYSSSITKWPEEESTPYLVDAWFVTQEEAEDLATKATVFVYTASWDGWVGMLARKAHYNGARVICVFADIGYGVEKVANFKNEWLPPFIIVPDPVTYGLLLKAGVPENNLIKAGSPYLDWFLRSKSRKKKCVSEKINVGLLLSPEANYQENNAGGSLCSQIDASIRAAKSISQLSNIFLTVRPHPKMDVTELSGYDELASISTDKAAHSSSIEEFCAKQDIIVGVRSLGLLVARVLGLHAVSFQPISEGMGSREAVFEKWGVSLARNEWQLRKTISAACLNKPNRINLKKHIYNAGFSLDEIYKIARTQAC